MNRTSVDGRADDVSPATVMPAASEASSLPVANETSASDSSELHSSAAHASANVWERIKEHKVMHWTLAYAAFGYTLLHGAEMVSEALEWPHFVVRLLTLVLFLGAPVTAILAWYHGHKAQHRVSGAELMIITLLLFIGGSLLWAFSPSSEAPATKTIAETTPATAAANTAPTAVAASSTVAPAAPRTAIAVMPFANLTGDDKKDYLGEGMAEEVINVLTKVQGLKVPARTSSFAYKGRNTDVRQIAKDLGVGAILEGSVRSAGTRIRITAQLINAEDGLHIWSETYDEQFTDLFKLQDNLAKAIVKALEMNLGATGLGAVKDAPPTQDVEAYNLYLQGWSLTNLPSEQNLKRAIDYFQQAIARDPKFARAYDGLANAHMEFWLTSSDAKLKVAHLAAAELAARQVLALDPSIASAHMVLAGVSGGRSQWLEMESHSLAALSLGANDGYIHAVRTNHLSPMGRLREALQEAQKGYALAPANPQVVAALAERNSIIGHEADAAKYGGLARELGYPEDGWFAYVAVNTALRAKHYAEAAVLLNKTFDVSDPEQARAVEVVRLVFAALADPTQRSAALAARARLYPKNRAGLSSATSFDGVACFTSSSAYALLGEMDVAYDLSNQCLDQSASDAGRDSVLQSWLWSPEMRLFRKDSRFQAYLTRGGLMDYYQQYGPPDDCDLKDGKLTCH